MGRSVTPPSAAASNGGEGDNYSTRVAKYVPVETVTLFVTAMELLEAHGSKPIAGFTQQQVAVAIALLGFALTPVYLWKSGAADSGRVYTTIIGTLAFIPWAYATGGSLAWGTRFEHVLAALSLPVFTFVVGAFKPK